MARQNSGKDSGTPSGTFKVGAIALAFLIIGYQSALFVHRAAALHVAAQRDAPDTVYVMDEALASRLLGASWDDAGSGADVGPGRAVTSSGSGGSQVASGFVGPRDDAGRSVAGSGTDQDGVGYGSSGSSGGSYHTTGSNGFNNSSRTKGSAGGHNVSGGKVVIRRDAEHSEAVRQVRRQTRRVETFPFDPNTVSLEDLVRLGFTEKQAQSIDNYRKAGGRFRRASDFARSYVVSDSVFQRLQPYIRIPKTDINRADSAAFDALPGIGPYFAAKMVSYRERLGGYSYKEQLMDIYNFDREKYDGLSDLITCSPPAAPFRLWSLPEDSLRLHPYIRSRQAAHSIVLYRNNTPREAWSVDALGAAGILPPEDASRLARCKIAE